MRRCLLARHAGHADSFGCWCVQGGDDSSDDGEEGGSGEGMDEDMQDAHTAVKAAPAEPQAPIIDEDGFQLVQSKRKGRR